MSFKGESKNDEEGKNFEDGADFHISNNSSRNALYIGRLNNLSSSLSLFLPTSSHKTGLRRTSCFACSNSTFSTSPHNAPTFRSGDRMLENRLGFSPRMIGLKPSPVCSLAGHEMNLVATLNSSHQLPSKRPLHQAIEQVVQFSIQLPLLRPRALVLLQKRVTRLAFQTEEWCSNNDRDLA
jgi:hypothetical protein